MNVVEKEVQGFNDAWLVEHEGKSYVLSSVIAFDTGKYETLAFDATAAGDPMNGLHAVAGGIGMTKEEVMQQIVDGTFDEDAHTAEWLDTAYDGDPLAAILGVLDGAVRKTTDSEIQKMEESFNETH